MSFGKADNYELSFTLETSKSSSSIEIKRTPVGEYSLTHNDRVSGSSLSGLVDRSVRYPSDPRTCIPAQIAKYNLELLRKLLVLTLEPETTMESEIRLALSQAKEIRSGKPVDAKYRFTDQFLKANVLDIKMDCKYLRNDFNIGDFNVDATTTSYIHELLPDSTMTVHLVINSCWYR